VAIDTLDAKGFSEIKFGGGGIRMTGKTVGSYMRTQERESSTLMDFSDTVYNPGFRTVTAGTVRSQCLVMHVGVTRYTFSSGICKLQGRMTPAAVNSLMLSRKREFCGCMVE
jgi:hypothetical protein